MHDLKKLMAATEKAIEMALDAQDTFKDEAVNWAHLRCVDAQLIRHDNETESYTVIIEEASPENPDFQRFIAEELAHMGYPDVEVRTEW